MSQLRKGTGVDANTYIYVHMPFSMSSSNMFVNKPA